MNIVGFALFGFSLDLYYEKPLAFLEEDTFFYLERSAYTHGFSIYVWNFCLSLYTPFAKKVKEHG